MHDYDTVLKLLLQKSLQNLTGDRIIRWLPTELPKVQNLRIDLLGEAADHRLVQIEVQSTNDVNIPFRMLEYLVLVNRAHGQVPRQIVLYVGRDPLRMANRFSWADGEARFTLIDMRDIDGEPLVTSPEPSDNVLGILARLNDHRAAVRVVLGRVATLEKDQGDYYLQALLILAGLRGLEEVVQEEAKQMLTIDISENKVLGPAYKRGLQEGTEVGLHQGQMGLLRQMIESKFGPLPAWAEHHLSERSSPQLEQIGIRLLEATTLEGLLLAG